jgi:hypothetical protein
MPWELTGNPDGDIGPNNFLGTRANDPLRIRTRSSVNNADAMTITPAPDAATTGNVGIGTGSPRSRFQLKSLTAIDEGATAAGAWANFGSNAFYDGAWKRIDQTRAGVNLHINPDGAGQEFRFLRVEADGSRLRNLAVIGSTTSFINEGNVGIGTATPGAKLDISGSGGANQCCAPVFPTLSLAEASSTQNRQAWLQFHNAGEAEAFIRLAGGGPAGSGREGQRRLEIGDSQGANTGLTVQGDIRLLGADCAENFDVSEAETAEPGTVMVIDQEGTLKPSEQAYDKRVAGVISGAEGYKTGIVLDEQESEADRMPVALMGKVYCKVDARHSPIGVGDLLTTSSTLGYAMKADDPLRAFGAVLGKAVRPLKEGQGLIPVLVALQ